VKPTPRRDRMPRLGWVAVASLAIASLVFLSMFVRTVLAVLPFGIDPWLSLQLESTWSIGGPLLVYGLVFAAMAIGIALRWRVAHLLTTILLTIAIVPAVPSLPSLQEQTPTLEILMIIGAAIVAWLCLVITWRAFWRRPADG
jgi:hypothetical protein